MKGKVPMSTTLPAGTTSQGVGYHVSDAEAWNARARKDEEIQAHRIERDAANYGGDRGARGPAMAGRTSEFQPSDMPGHATLAYADAHLIDRMHQRGQMGDRQHQAAQRVYGLFRKAGLEPRTCSPPGERRDPTVDADEATEQAHAAWRRFMGRREIAGQKGELLVSMCLERHPGTRWLATLHAALEEVARMKRLDPQEGA